jgi:hypothetical protein
MTASNKRYSYPRVTAIRIDVHPAEETRPIHHTHPTLCPRMVPDHTYLTWSTHSNLSQSHQQNCTDPLPREEGLLTQFTAQRSSDPRVRTQLLSHNNQWGNGEKTSFGWNQLLGLPDSYHRHAIGTFNTCSQGLTHRSLTDTSGGYNLEGASLKQTTLWPSQLMISTFHLRTPPSLQFIQVPSIKPEFEFKGTYARHVVFRPLDPLSWPTTMPSHS